VNSTRAEDFPVPDSAPERAVSAGKVVQPSSAPLPVFLKHLVFYHHFPAELFWYYMLRITKNLFSIIIFPAERL